MQAVKFRGQLFFENGSFLNLCGNRETDIVKGVDKFLSKDNLLFQADILGVTVRRPAVQETTALGAAYLAGIAEGVWSTPAEAASAWREAASFTPAMDATEVDARLATWHRAVGRSRAWATD